MTQTKARIGIVTVSDRASRGEYEDLSGPGIEEQVKTYFRSKEIDFTICSS